MNDGFRLYRASSTAGATHLDLILATYDALAQDLNLIAGALDASNVEARCKASNHGLWLLGYLESWVELLREEELEGSLRTFYSFLRGELMQLQFRPVADSVRRLVLMVCETRAAWQQKLKPVPSESTARPLLHESVATDTGTSSGWSA